MATASTAPSFWLSVPRAASRQSASSSTACCSSSFPVSNRFSRFSLSRNGVSSLECARQRFSSLGPLRRASGFMRSGCARSSLNVHDEQPLSCPSVIEELQKRLLVTSRDGEIRWKETLSAAVLATASFLQVGDWALAGEFGPRFRDLPDFRTTPEGWVVVGITSLVAAVVYFFVIPLILYYYLHVRWYKRNLLETIFQFLLVFLFFPGLLLLAPFINLRPLPKDGAKSP